MSTDNADLRAGSAAHYEDPELYSLHYGRRRTDVRFYVDMARRTGGPVLEYGCGNGRIALALATVGFSVTGSDASEPMLSDLEARLKHEGPAVRARVRAVRGDIRTTRVEGTFPLVVAPFNTFLHLYDRVDVERFLAGVRAHLAPGGRLAFDTSVPSPADLSRDKTRPVAGRPLKLRGVRYRYRERFEWDPLLQVLLIEMAYIPEDGSPGFSRLLAHRQYFPKEIEAVLHYGGFEVERCLADFSDAPAHRGAGSLAWVCRDAR
jgi:SAM-dependent methyltransferase